MCLRGRLAELLIKSAPDVYGPFARTNSKGETVLYVRLLNALYGIMKAALLYYQKFLADVTAIGFKLNPYESEGACWRYVHLNVSFVCVSCRSLEWIASRALGRMNSPCRMDKTAPVIQAYVFVDYKKSRWVHSGPIPETTSNNAHYFD